MTGVSLSRVVREGRPALIVTWTTPQSDVTISEYRVQYRRSGTTVWGTQVTATPPATSAYLRALYAGTEYDVRVRARSAAEDGEWSEVQTERTFNGEHMLYILRHPAFMNHVNLSEVYSIKMCHIACDTSVPEWNSRGFFIVNYLSDSSLKSHWHFFDQDRAFGDTSFDCGLDSSPK